MRPPDPRGDNRIHGKRSERWRCERRGRVGLQNRQLVKEGNNPGLKGGTAAKTGDNEGKKSNQSWVHRPVTMISDRTEPVHFNADGVFGYPQARKIALCRYDWGAAKSSDSFLLRAISVIAAAIHHNA